jgi:IS30 family transposase
MNLEERVKIQKLIEEGNSIEKISLAIGRAKSSVSRELMKCEDKRYNAIEAHVKHKELLNKRNKELTRFFSKQEVEKIKEGMAVGKSKNSIQKDLNTSFRKIRSWFKENYPEYRGGELSDIATRVSNIEQQLEIIIDLLKNRGA